MFTDSLSVFHVLTRYSRTAEKRFKIDRASIQESHQNMEAAEVAFVCLEYSLADPLIKIKLHAVFQDILTISNINHPVEQWVNREKKAYDSVVVKRECPDVG